MSFREASTRRHPVERSTSFTFSSDGRRPGSRVPPINKQIPVLVNSLAKQSPMTTSKKPSSTLGRPLRTINHTTLRQRAILRISSLSSMTRLTKQMSLHSRTSGRKPAATQKENTTSQNLNLKKPQSAPMPVHQHTRRLGVGPHRRTQHLRKSVKPFSISIPNTQWNARCSSSTRLLIKTTGRRFTPD